MRWGVAEQFEQQVYDTKEARMGGEAWSYFTPFEKSVHAALEKLRDQVFESGKFRGSEMEPGSPEEALANMEDQGTASILDITDVSPTPEFCAVSPLPDEELESYFGTTEPTHEMILENQDFFEPIERGQGIYMTVYNNGRPSEYFFAGYSFD
jgi:hypothetical protein